jgi:hypothetical protein
MRVSQKQLIRTGTVLDSNDDDLASGIVRSVPSETFAESNHC